jgi:sugar phosphate isomerase/epimerase
MTEGTTNGTPDETPDGTSRRFGVVSYVFHTGGLVADLAADARSARDAGVDGLSVDADELLRLGPREARRLVNDAGLSVSSVMAIGPAVSAGETGSIDTELAVLDATAAIGAPGVLAFTGPRGELPAREADARARAWLERLAPRAVDLDLAVMVEPMFPMMRAYTYVHTLAHAFALVADLDGAKVVIDTAHLWWDPRLVELFAEHVDDVGTVQLTNVSSAALDARRFTRAPLDDGEVPLRDVVEAFDAAGYRGWYENEVLTEVPEDRVEFVRDSRTWFDAIWDDEGV